MKDLLICIPYHHAIHRFQFLFKNLNHFIGYYKCSLDIIIDSNVAKLYYPPFSAAQKNRMNIIESYHQDMTHPFHLTYFHRQHFKDNIENYRNFMYIEDDILLPYENYLNYLDNFKLLWPNFVPSFIRLEKNNDEYFVTDETERQKLTPTTIGGKQFANLIHPYHGFWILPQQALKETMTPDFADLKDSREFAASYPMWTLNKTSLVEIENGQVSEKCYSYHLPNTYAIAPESPYGKIKINEIFY